MSNIKNWVKKNIVEPVKKFVSNAIKIATKETVTDLKKKRREIIFKNVSASAGISIGAGGGTKIAGVGVEGSVRADIVGIKLQDGKVTVGHHGKSGGSFSYQNFTFDQHFENFEPFGGIGTCGSDPANVRSIDHGFEFSSTAIFVIGYHYDISISFVGIFTDTIEWIYKYDEESL